MYSYYGPLLQNATTLAGAPLPPVILRGKTAIRAPLAGRPAMASLKFSMPYIPAPSKMRWASKVLQLPGSRDATWREEREVEL